MKAYSAWCRAARRTTRFWPLLALATLAPAWAGEPVGGQFQVNTYVTSTQNYADVAVAPNGAFVVVWDSRGSSGTDSSGRSVLGQRYAPDGTPVSGEFQVNTYTLSYQTQPAVAMAPSGSFVVVWQSLGSSGSDASAYSVQGQRYAADGSTENVEFQVNTYTNSNQYRPAIAMNDDGEFMVVWTSQGSTGSDDSGASVQMRRYAADGIPFGPESQVNENTSLAQRTADVDIGPDGELVIVWETQESAGDDTDGFGISARLFGGGGVSVNSEFQVNTYTTNTQAGAVVARAPDGDFVIAWTSNESAGPDTSGQSIQARRYTADGTALGPEFLVNAYTTSTQGGASIDIASDGDFVVSWHSYAVDGSGYGIDAQRFSEGGNPVGGSFVVNALAAGTQRVPSVGSSAAGDLVVAWQSSTSYGTDTVLTSIQGQRFSVMIFADGFESGDTSAWSSAVQ